MTDPSLLSRCQRGDSRAWCELFDRFLAAVYRWSMGFGLDRASAEEVSQEVFTTAFQKIGTCQDDRQIAAWLFQITRRHAANARRLAWVRRVLGAGPNAELARPEDTGQSDVDADERVTYELSLDVRRALRSLPVKYAEVLILHDLEGHSREEVAEIVGIAAGTVASRLEVARKRFQAQWQSVEGSW